MSSSASRESTFGSGLFARLLTETGISDTRFARQVNLRARREHHMELGLARTTVGHWRRGMRPRDPLVADLAAAEISAAVGYPVTPADFGWRGTHDSVRDLGLVIANSPEATIGTLTGLSSRDVRRVDAAPDGTVFRTNAFAEPALASLTGIIPRAAGRRPSPTRGRAVARGHDAPVDGASATMIRDTVAALRRLDARFGARDIRHQAVALLHDQLRVASAGTADTELCSALAELAQFAGWLAQECGRQALAQRYYIQALGLAEHACDAMLAARVLSAMSEQMIRLGHRRQSLALAGAALDRAGHGAAPLVRAMLHDRQAWALAGSSDEAGCTSALRALEQAVSRAEPEEGPAWAGHYNAGDVAECTGHCLRLLGRALPAERQLVESRTLQDSGRVRSRSFAEADLALSYLQRPVAELDGALEAAYAAIRLGAGLSSLRVTEKLRELDREFAEYPTVAVQKWRRTAAVRPDGVDRSVAQPRSLDDQKSRRW
ncbi:transcriptional regulator [Pseudofrankia inefficax]|uniref:Putative transcriptional regulator n=1 Tax=Pseudofrankia inefficax (strain DSM 45817 / CECT 9037 / DDB 130130 / EuI1c) TaxID=298654 RepID=E3JCW2_PSEI1|nr:transcriptional regulator [Pseudofrankia inefficax]ADP79952.1 putative transcriptional regulator [Pseudofrankia inefficax]